VNVLPSESDVAYSSADEHRWVPGMKIDDQGVPCISTDVSVCVCVSLSLSMSTYIERERPSHLQCAPIFL